jgi:hypothetical protein
MTWETKDQRLGIHLAIQSRRLPLLANCTSQDELSLHPKVSEVKKSQEMVVVPGERAVEVTLESRGTG